MSTQFNACIFVGKAGKATRISTSVRKYNEYTGEPYQIQEFSHLEFEVGGITYKGKEIWQIEEAIRKDGFKAPSPHGEAIYVGDMVHSIVDDSYVEIHEGKIEVAKNKFKARFGIQPTVALIQYTS